MAKATAELFKNRIVGYDTKPADQFTANPLNYRKHPQRQRDAVNASPRELGWISTVVENVTTGNVIDGHERIWQALQRNEDVPYLKVELSEAEERLALAVFDPITNMAETDAAILDDLLREVNTGEAALQALLAELADGAGLYGDKGTEGDTPAQVDRAEELRQKWQTAPGQLWQLGEHRLVCGDCTDAATVARVMGGERAQLCFTSPPYNAGVSAKLSGNTSIDDNLYKDEYDDNQTQADYLELLKSFTEVALSACEYVFVNIQFLAGNKRAFVDYLACFAPKLADIAIWDKKHAAPAAAQRVMDSRFEFVVMLSHTATRAVGTRNFRGMVHNVYEGAPQRNNEYAADHAATFPVEFPTHFIETFTNRGELIFEPFCGTGTTIIACENLGRRCMASEISPSFTAIALERWSVHTGRQPVLVDI